jgi:hypothetical protein
MHASVDRRYTSQSVVGDRHDHQDFSGQHHDLTASARGGPVDTCAFRDCQRSSSGCVLTQHGGEPCHLQRYLDRQLVTITISDDEADEPDGR